MKLLMMAITVATVVVSALAANTPIVLNSQIRANDPTVLDVTYKVTSVKPTVNVRALAFEDGERSFWKVVRPETFVKDVDGNETAQNVGNGISANVEHKLSWKVSADWKTDLAKVRFEVLVSETVQLPMKTITIPATAKTPALTVAVNSQSDTDIFNALMWHYADFAESLKLKDGNLYTMAGELLSGRTEPGEGNRMSALRYVYERMGWQALEYGPLLGFVKSASREYDLAFNSLTQNAAVLKMTMPTSLYIGEKVYWAIDLETGECTYFDSVPIAGWGEEYKKTKLLMRRIEPGSVTTRDVKQVTLTKPFYIGVFEVTQSQYALINGSNPSAYKGDMRPVERVSYDDIRGTDKGAQWPNAAEFDETSWLGRLKARVGIHFDLPTESQWEYACRAGTTSWFNNGGRLPADLNVLGRWNRDRSDGRGGFSEHTTSGSYIPNAWGLYDMHGNVYEWCLDKKGSINSDPAIDFRGADSGSERILRGGSWDYDYFNERFPSSYLYGDPPSTRKNSAGFRLVMAVAE